MLKLAANHITKKYGKRKVVDDVSIEVSQGEIVGLLGQMVLEKQHLFIQSLD